MPNKGQSCRGDGMRIRTIKPEFWKSESVGRLNKSVRLMYIGLWNHADDHGLFRAQPALIRSELFPYDDDVTNAIIAEWLEQLVQNDHMIILYKGLDGNQYGWIPKWKQHQRIDKPQASKIPYPQRKDIPRTFLEDSKNSLGTFLDDSCLEQGREQGTGNRAVS